VSADRPPVGWQSLVVAAMLCATVLGVVWLVTR
jgi:hypothetical protein